MTFETGRRLILLLIGAGGLIYEIVSPGDARLTLLITDLVLVGLVPVDVLISRHAGGGRHSSDAQDQASP